MDIPSGSQKNGPKQTFSTGVAPKIWLQLDIPDWSGYQKIGPIQTMSIRHSQLEMLPNCQNVQQPRIQMEHFCPIWPSPSLFLLSLSFSALPLSDVDLRAEWALQLIAGVGLPLSTTYLLFPFHSNLRRHFTIFLSGNQPSRAIKHCRPDQVKQIKYFLNTQSKLLGKLSRFYPYFVKVLLELMKY